MAAVSVALQSEACTPPSLLQGLRPRGVAGILSKLLADGGIPSVIWGTMALSYYNVPTVILVRMPFRVHLTTLNFISIIQEIAVVVPDEQFDKATSVISNIGVRRCHCQDWNSSNTCHSFLVPAPPAHWLISALIYGVGHLHCGGSTFPRQVPISSTKKYLSSMVQLFGHARFDIPSCTNLSRHQSC